MQINKTYKRIQTACYVQIRPAVKSIDTAWHISHELAGILVWCDYWTTGTTYPNFQYAKDIITIMAKGTHKTSSTVPWNGFINIYMDDLAKEDFLSEKWLKDKDVSELLNEFILSGHSMSLKYDTRSECFMSSMRGEKADGINAGYCVTSRHPDAVEALKLGLYKHYVMCETDWTQYKRSDTAKGWG